MSEPKQFDKPQCTTPRTDGTDVGITGLSVTAHSYKLMRDLARLLERELTSLRSAQGRDEARAAYNKANPLGGPANTFDAIAQRIRAGEEYHAVLADYDLRHVERDQAGAVEPTRRMLDMFVGVDVENDEDARGLWRAVFRELSADGLVRNAVGTTFYANPQQVPQRGEAVNLARNWLDAQGPNSSFHITKNGVRQLAEAVTLMDAWILEVTKESFPSNVEAQQESLIPDPERQTAVRLPQAATTPAAASAPSCYSPDEVRPADYYDHFDKPRSSTGTPLATSIDRMRKEWARAAENDDMPDFDGQDLMDVLAAAETAQSATGTSQDYEEVLANHRRLCRELDAILSYPDEPARQASLCDLVPFTKGIAANSRRYRFLKAGGGNIVEIVWNSFYSNIYSTAMMGNVNAAIDAAMKEPK